MRELVAETIALANAAIEKYRNPALLVSFGKDSMVLLHLLREHGLPVVCHQTPFQKHKWKFANQMAASLKLTMHSYPPEWVAMHEVDGGLFVLSAYSSGTRSKRVIVQRTEKSPAKENLVCGLHDVLHQPKSKTETAWDLLICAQKNGDFHAGPPAKINSDLLQSGDGVDTLFPMRNWTDKDVFAYTKEHRISHHTERYDEDDSLGLFVEREQTEHNPDVINGCFDCIDKRKSGETVLCQRLGGILVNNISDSIPYIDNPSNPIQ